MNYRLMNDILYGFGDRVIPGSSLVDGISQPLGKVSLYFCKIPTKNMNMQALARASPKHLRFPCPN